RVSILLLYAHFTDIAPSVGTVFQSFCIDHLVAKHHPILVNGQKTFPEDGAGRRDQYAEATTFLEGATGGAGVNVVKRAIGAGDAPYLAGGEAQGARVINDQRHLEHLNLIVGVPNDKSGFLASQVTF